MDVLLFTDVWLVQAHALHTNPLMEEGKQSKRKCHTMRASLRHSVTERVRGCFLDVNKKLFDL